MIDGREIVDQYALFCFLSRFFALHLLDVFVAQVRKQGQIGSVASEADLAHFHEEDPSGFVLIG